MNTPIELLTMNVGYYNPQQSYAKDQIMEMLNKGWGIDRMVTDENRDTWVTFYRYKSINISPKEYSTY